MEQECSLYAITQGHFEVTTVFPVRSEGQSQFHSSEKNLKWDVVFCCRHAKVGKKRRQSNDVNELKLDFNEVRIWKKRLKTGKLQFSEADARSLAFGMLSKQICNHYCNSSEAITFDSWKSTVHSAFVRTDKTAQNL
jgi:putative DNA methylase